MSSHDSERKRGTRPAARQHVNWLGDVPEGVGPHPDGPYYCDVHRDDQGVGVAWVLRDEREVAFRWIVSTVGVELEEMR